MIYFETERLIFRDWKKEDLLLFQEMNRDPDVMNYFPKVLSNEETENFFCAIQDEFEKKGFGLYAVELKEKQEFIGFIGFHEAVFEASFTPCIEIGWRLKKEAWGYGYATEGAKACLEYGLKKLELEKVYSFTAEINKPSEAVMKKIGLVKVDEFEHPRVDKGHILCNHILYCTTNEES